MRTTEKTLNCPHLIATSRSNDFGHSWSVITPTKERIPNPESGVDMIKLENGHIVMVCNPLPSGRQILAAFLSEDGGISFPISRDIEPENGIIGDGEYSYPAVIQTKDGVIHCTYTNLRQNIKHVAFDENWIKKIE
jgi:predicted neuraminidase